MAAVTPGRFIWHELLTTDPDGAIPFYERVIGWTTMPWEQDPSYRIFAWEGVPMAGLMNLPEEARSMGAPPHWLSYVSVRDLDATVSDAVRLGAMTYVEAMDIPSVGRIAVLGDPQRAVFGVYEPATSAGHGSDEPGLGDFSWHELATDDWKTAWEFYRALFGWEYDSQFDMGPMGTYWMFRRAGGTRMMGGMFNRPPEIPASHWLPYARVPNAHRVADLVQQHGGTVLNGPMEVPGGDFIVQLMDPHGAVFAVHAVVAQAEAAPAAAAPAPAPESTAKAEPRKPAPRKKAAAGKPAAQPATRKPVKKAAPKGRVKPKGMPVKKKPAKKR